MEEELAHRPRHPHMARVHIVHNCRLDERAAGHRLLFAGQRRRHHKERGEVEGRIPAHDAAIQPPRPTAQGRVRLIDGQRGIEERQTGHLLAGAKERIDAGVVRPQRQRQVPAQAHRHAVAGGQWLGQVHPHRGVLRLVDKGGRPVIHRRALDCHLSAILMERGIEAKDQIAPGVRAVVGHQNIGGAGELRQCRIDRDLQRIARGLVHTVQLALEVGLERGAIEGIGIDRRAATAARGHAQEQRQQRRGHSGHRHQAGQAPHRRRPALSHSQRFLQLHIFTQYATLGPRRLRSRTCGHAKLSGYHQRPPAGFA